MNKLLLPIMLMILAMPARVSAAQPEDDNPVGRHHANTVMVQPHPQLDQLLGYQKPLAFDLDGDGADEVAWSTNGLTDEDPGVVYIFSRKDGKVTEISTDLILGDKPNFKWGYQLLLPADFNLDGQTDLFLAANGGEPDCGAPGDLTCWTGGQNALLLSNGGGKLVDVTGTHLPQILDFTHGPTLLDYDSDGDMDIYVNNNGGGELIKVWFSYLMENDGNGRFKVVADNPQITQAPIAGTNGIFPEPEQNNGEWGSNHWVLGLDANADGHDDLAIAEGFEYYDMVLSRRSMMLLNTGQGAFEFVSGDAWPLPDLENGANAQGGHLNDFNGDGLMDMMFLIDFPEVFSFQMLISNGDGTFRDESERFPHTPVWPAKDIQLHDLDGDGHKDIFWGIGVWSDADRHNLVFMNDGSGHYRLLEKDWIKTGTMQWVVFDADGDGGTDVLINDLYGVTFAEMVMPYRRVVNGTGSDDRLVGGGLDNIYNGLAGNDLLDGGLGDDKLAGGPGDDVLKGGKGDDLLIGGDGNDLLWGDQGTDQLIGGTGTDVARFEGALAEYAINFFYPGLGWIIRRDTTSADLLYGVEILLFDDGATVDFTGTRCRHNWLQRNPGFWQTGACVWYGPPPRG